MIFVFGSNESGFHGAGAARYAVDKEGAIMRQAEGRQGNSYGIPTLDKRLQMLSIPEISNYVQKFIEYATNTTDQFKVTQIGCGLAGRRADQIAPLFALAPDNCYFDSAWKPWLGEERNYWGTYGG